MPKTNNSQPKVIAIVGPTASGKTDLARRLALAFKGELISADSRQIYRRLDIGTGKEGELKANTISLTDKYPQLRFLTDDIPQWLIDIAEPTETYTVADFQRDALEITADIVQRGKLPILVGGTGLYVSALLEGYDFSVKTERDPNNPRHAQATTYKKSPPEWDVLTIGIDLPRTELYQRIDQRVLDRIGAGMIDEAKQLLDSDLTPERLRQFGLEYRFLADHLTGQIDQSTMIRDLQFAIHAYARRQLTWWRHHGPVEWHSDHDTIQQRVTEFLNN